MDVRIRLAAEDERTDWGFGGTWPYRPRWLSTDELRIHYVDEGPAQGEPVIMLHGHPAWSYVYRHFIGGLAEAGFRAIAHDMAGFGRSDKPKRIEDYSIQRNVKHFDALVNHLSLDRVTLVLHDWGGPLGLAWAVNNADRVQRLIVLNSFTGSIPPNTTRRALRWIKVMRSRVVGDLLVRGARLPVRVFLLEKGIAHHERIGLHERAAYLAPHPHWRTRAGLLAYPRMWPLEQNHPTASVAHHIERGLPKLAEKPVLVCRGLKDPGLRAGLMTLGEEQFPQAEVHEFEDASHFVQEDAHERIVPLIVDFMART